jgi:hypothetical protein
MTTSPNVPDDDAPPPTEEEYDDSGRHVGGDPGRTEEADTATDDELDDEPPAIQPRSS